MWLVLLKAKVTIQKIMMAEIKIFDRMKHNLPFSAFVNDRHISQSNKGILQLHKDSSSLADRIMHFILF